MLHKIPKILIYFFLIVFILQLASLILLLILPQPSQAGEVKFKPQVEIGEFKKGIGKIVTGKTIGEYIRAIYKYAIGIVGILAAVVMMFGGVLWITAGGSPERVSSAKAWIGASLTGLVLTLCSYMILKTVNPALVEFKPLYVKKVSKIITGRCLTPALPGPYICEDNLTENQWAKDKPDNKWQKGQICPTPCCAWNLHVSATALCQLTPGCFGNLYEECIDTQKNLTKTDCDSKPGISSYKDNGKCNKRTLLGTGGTLISYECVNKK